MLVLLPAQTRYEQTGGGTSTNTERRIRFSPEIPGRRIGEAVAEWEIPARLGRAMGREEAFAFPTSQSVRERDGTADAAVPGHRGPLAGGTVGAVGRRAARGERALRDPGRPRAFHRGAGSPAWRSPEGHFFLASRRGKQFNSITYGPKDGVTRAKSRKAIFFAPEDANRLGLKQGEAVVLSSTLGTMQGEVELGPCRPGHLQAFWPECNVLVGRKYDPVSGEPDYNAFVRVAKA